MEPKLRYTAVEKGDINLIDAYSTDAELKQYNMANLLSGFLISGCCFKNFSLNIGAP
jgi:hypothetical protein